MNGHIRLLPRAANRDLSTGLRPSGNAGRRGAASAGQTPQRLPLTPSPSILVNHRSSLYFLVSQPLATAPADQHLSAARPAYPKTQRAKDRRFILPRAPVPHTPMNPAPHRRYTPGKAASQPRAGRPLTSEVPLSNCERLAGCKSGTPEFFMIGGEPPSRGTHNGTQTKTIPLNNRPPPLSP
eukprot:XP_001694703.1 predicted protein [Chlamydomonas reinhardtii]